MSNYGKKFGFDENEDTIKFHKSRRMFVIKDSKLIIAEPNLPYSHPEWFEKEGWMNQKNDQFMKTNVRGSVMKNGEIRFYVDWDFQINEHVEQQFMPHLEGLVNNLGLNTDAPLNGGALQKEGFKPRKSFGTIADNISI